MKTVGFLLLYRLIEFETAEVFIKLQLKKEYFKESESPLFIFIQEHVGKYGVLPKKESLKDFAGVDFIPANEPLEFYQDSLRRRYLSRQIKMAVQEIAPQLTDAGSGDYDPQGALNTLTQRMIDLNFEERNDSIYDYRQAKDQIVNLYMENLNGGDGGVMLGWPSLDTMTRGLRGGDFVSYVGRPAAGKTFQLLYSAYQVWKAKGAPMFISLEMSNDAILERLVSIDCSKSLTRFRAGTLSTETISEMITKIENNKQIKTPFWLMDGGFTATPGDIEMVARQLKPSCIFVDGAYLLRNKERPMATHERVAFICESLKLLSVSMDVPVIASFQFNREAAKKKKTGGQAVGLEDIAFTDVIGQLSSLVLGLFQEDSIETTKQRTVTILKGRNGEIGQFNIHWDFMGMDFGEVVDVVEDYKYI